MNTIEITPEVYREIANLLESTIQGKSYYSGTIQTVIDGVTHRLVCTLLVYHHGTNNDRINTIVPVWWELHTFQNEEEVPNDFSFSEIRMILEDHP